jgi:hypothetical protein
VTVSFDSPLDIAAICAAPAEEKLAAMNAFHVHCTANTQQARDAGGRFFYRCLLKYVSTAIRPN